MGAKPIGEVASVEGEAYIARPLKKKEPAEVGQKVFEKDKVKTNEGKVVINLYEQGEIKVGPKSYMKISAKSGSGGSSTKLALYSGGIDCKVKKQSADQSFTIKTPSAVAGVRGTDLSVTQNPSTMGMGTYVRDEGPGKASELVTGPAENEQQVMNAAKQAPGSDPGPGCSAVKQNEASYTSPTGQTFVSYVGPGADPKQVAAKMQQDAQMAEATGKLTSMEMSAEAAFAERIQLLESRLENISVSAPSRVLPSVPDAPDKR